MLPNNVLRYGKEGPLPERRELRAGPLTVVYEDGDVRYVKYGDQEILRRVYVAIRDSNWGTVPPRLYNLQTEAGSRSFRISYDVENKAGEIDFLWKGTIVGDPQGTITFTMEGVARSTFMRCRIGFCILHPIKECAGRPCTVENTDGSREDGTFPLYVSPHEPFLDMRAISHQVAPGVWAEVRFSGDIFDMEDQRNWTDASYKTYCTPLTLPFPVEVQEGTRITQSVTLKLRGEVLAPQAKVGQAGLTFTAAHGPGAALPKIGLGMATHGGRLTPLEVQRLKALNLSYLRADVWFARSDWKASLACAIGEARALDVDLEAALILSDAADDELKALVAALEAAGRSARPRICRWLIFHQSEKSTTEKWIQLAREHLSSYEPRAQFVSGTNHFFAELNRERPPTSVLDAVTYSINPEVHAFDNASLVENLAAQAFSVESARQFSNGLPIIVSPVTFRMRLNPNATGPEPETPPGQMPRRVDTRQMSLFGAAWTLGSMKYLAESGVQSATYYETTGWLGVMEREAGSPLPGAFRSWPGSVFPMYHVFADLGELAGCEVIPSISSEPLQLDGLAVRRSDGGMRVLIANMSDEQQSVSVLNLVADVRVRQIDETNAEEAMQAPEGLRAHPGSVISTDAGTLRLILRPYSVACIDTI